MRKPLKRLFVIFGALALLGSFICAAAETTSALNLPSALQVIDVEAFYGDNALQKVVVPDGTTEIRSRAFAGSSITELVLPDTLTLIAEDAFQGCSEFTVVVPENCYAYDRCVELGLITLGNPDLSWIESEHPYADNFDYTWTYDAGEGTESVTITFAAETETEDGYDFVYIYTLDDVEVGKYTGTELAGQSVTVDGTGFKLRLTSDEAWDAPNAYYGFRLESIVPKLAVPLALESITAENSTVIAGETIRWTVATTGGKEPVYCDYTVLRGEEEIASGTMETPAAIEYVPMKVGEYRLSVAVRDSNDVALPAVMSEVVTAAPSAVYPESKHPYPPRWEGRWFYAAEENVQKLLVTFSEESEIHKWSDFAVYDQDGALVKTYAGKDLAGKTLEIIGNAFTIHLNAPNAGTAYGFSITNIEKYVPGPMSFVSMTVDKAKTKVGEPIVWTLETEGGHWPVTYVYTITLNGETKYTGSVTRPDTITYIPMEAGDYTLSVVTRDAEGNELEAQTSKVRAAAQDATPEADFTYEAINGLDARLTGYTGEDTTVIVPETVGGYKVTEIGSRAFADHATLVSIALPATVTKIHEYAFSNCDALKAVHMEEGLVSVGYRAFEDCDELRSIVFPDSVTTLGDRVLRHCDNLSYVGFPVNWTNADVETVATCPRLTRIELPEGMKEVPADAFRSCRFIREVVFPSTMQVINEDAFYDCVRLNKINLPDGLEEIRMNAFCGTALTAIDVPASVTYLSGFHGCKQLKDVRLHEGLVEIGRDAFHTCTSLVEIEIPESVRTISYYAFCNCEKLKSIKLPDGVRTINEYAFHNCKSLESFDYPLSWTTVNGNNIFEGCEKLTSVTIPEGVTEIPRRAFSGNIYLKEVNFPSTLEVIGSDAFAGCKSLTKVVIPQNVITIGFWTFNGCTNLEEVVFNEVLKEIRPGAFANCPSLVEINLPDSVKEIGEQCFENCTGLETFRYPLSWEKVTSRHNNGALYGGNIFTGCTKMTSYTIPEGVTTIPNSAFEGATSLEEIHFPSTLETIGCDAFKGCTKLTVIELPANLKTLRLNVFRDCTGIKDVIFNDGLESVQAGAFAYCTSLVDADLPDSVQEIGELCFEGCAALKSFHYPMSWARVTSRYDNGALYGGGTFKNCPGLTSITVPEGITAIPDYAFAASTYLEEVSLPSTLEVVGRWAFEYCPLLTTVELPANVKSLRLRAFHGCEKLKDVVFPEGLEEIHAGCFGNCPKLLDADLPNSVKTVGEECFINCVSLTHFNYPLSLDYVSSRYENGHLYGGNTFTGCESLTSVVVPEGVQHIPAALFEGADYLLSVSLPSTLTKIGSTAFAGCAVMPQIYISPAVTTIWDNAFDHCPELTIWTEYGATALQHAIKRGIPYYYLTPDGVNIPSGTLYRGDGYNLYGYARASVPLTDVTATIWDGTGTNVIQTISVNPGVLDYNMAGTVNASLRFSELPLGNYRFTLNARTDVSEELWANTSFVIVPPPLRVYVTGLDGLTGAVGNDFAFGGMIYSNYPMTNVTVTLKNVSTGKVCANFTCAPNTLSYSLTGTTGISFAQLPTGNYQLTISVSGNGETKVPKDVFFTIGAFDQAISSDIFDQLVSFVGDPSNQMIFSRFNEGSAFLSSIDFSDSLFMSIHFRSEMCIDAISKALTSDKLSRFMVQRYKKEVAAIIDEIDSKTNLTTSDSMYIGMVESMTKNMRITFYVDKEDSLVPKYMKEMSKKVNDQLDELDKVCEIANWVLDAKDYYSAFLQNYENSLMILEVYSNYSQTTNPELKAAIEELAKDYTSKVSKALNLVTNLLIDNMSKQLYSGAVSLFKTETSLLNKVVTGSAGNFSLMLTIANFAIDATLELNNLDKIADNQMNAMIQIETFGQAVDSYYAAFGAVYEGDTSTGALNRLAISYQLCCISGERMYESLAKTAWFEKNYDDNNAFMSKYAELWRLESAEPFSRWR
ncbi:MAG: leucine-rich repeat protein [Clostridia bacterium]|nr:leucine-rich repeat protein [Clostridia bacterium]